METIIKVNPSELDETLIEKIRKFIGSKKNIDVTISLKEYDVEYADALDNPIDEAESVNDLISFAMDDLWHIVH